ncbi:uncharacterized protein LOC130626204 isoform X2 [Hydractinia symbiolongicarpus]|nr:uncharacterized protein LOC130626204 isoform X2 [Hydractinia symbiolongicarpus]
MDIPLINSNSLSYQQCERLSAKDDNINVNDCKISGVYSIDAIDGLKQSVKDHPFLVQQAMVRKRILFQCIQHRPNEQKDEESNSPTILIIVIVTVCLCLIILSILAVLLFRYRKKLRIRKKSQCAHYVVDETGQDNRYNAVNPAYEDVETKVSSHGEYATISNQVLKTTTEGKKSAENLYYKSTVMDSNNSTLDNTLSQNIYAELDEGSK